MVPYPFDCLDYLDKLGNQLGNQLRERRLAARFWLALWT